MTVHEERIRELGRQPEMQPKGISVHEERIREIDRQLSELPKGTLTYKRIHGKPQPYLQQTIGGRSVSRYIKLGERAQVLEELERRRELTAERQRLVLYARELAAILQRNPYLGAGVGLGYQDFGDFALGRQFYVDKTHFISQWLHHQAQVTLITRPRRFGKTLMLSTIEHFFEPALAGHEAYFERLKVWQDPDCRQLYGRIPVIFLSFGSVKGGNMRAALDSMAATIYESYDRHSVLADSPVLTEGERRFFLGLKEKLMSGYEEGLNLALAVVRLSELLSKHYGARPILLLDEYDTPLQDAWLSGYREEMLAFLRHFFGQVFKQSVWFDRALITGVTRISQNSLFSDMNNLQVVTVTGEDYGDCFGFTEQEVMDALKCRDMDEMAAVREMYDGFVFGSTRDIYNPWSIACFMRERRLASYWIGTGGNDLICDLIRRSPAGYKHELELLMRGERLHKRIDEHLALQYMDHEPGAFWALLLAAGYIKAEHVTFEDEYTVCDVSVTNREVMGMLRSQILRMFPYGETACTDFAEALLRRRIDEMNVILGDIAFTSMSYFDTGRRPSEKAPENFYHGLVLGLVVSLRDRYRITSNRESGLGRYDIAMQPLTSGEMAFIIEFKVRDGRREPDLTDTADRALAQIRDRHYEADLLAAGIPPKRICCLGIAFDGKEVLVKEG